MAVTHVATGAVAAPAAGTSISITTPAGAVGDIVIFFIVHDDHSDGPLSPSTPPVTVNTLSDGASLLADDSRGYVFWGVEDQAGGRSFTFGTLAASEEIRGVCVRYAGQRATTPLANLERIGTTSFPATQADTFGAMIVGFVFSDGAPGAQTPPSGWTERADSSATNRSIYVADRTATDYPFPMVLTPLNPTNTSGSQPGSVGISFSIEPDVSASTFTVDGVTRDSAGDPLPSCEVSLFKEVSAGVYQFVATQTSDGTTGAYSFTVYEDPSAFMVYARKDGTPNVFDATDNALTPA